MARATQHERGLGRATKGHHGLDRGGADRRTFPVSDVSEHWIGHSLRNLNAAKGLEALAAYSVPCPGPRMEWSGAMVCGALVVPS